MSKTPTSEHAVGYGRWVKTLISMHSTWVLGLVILLEGLLSGAWVQPLSKYPKASLIILGLFLMLQGWDIKRYQKELIQKRKRIAELEAGMDD